MWLAYEKLSFLCSCINTFTKTSLWHIFHCYLFNILQTEDRIAIKSVGTNETVYYNQSTVRCGAP